MLSLLSAGAEAAGAGGAGSASEEAAATLVGGLLAAGAGACIRTLTALAPVAAVMTAAVVIATGARALRRGASEARRIRTSSLLSVAATAPVRSNDTGTPG